MTGCSRKNKPQCVAPCIWVKGEGCKNMEKLIEKGINLDDIKEQNLETPKEVPCSKFNKPECPPDRCKWLKNIGCRKKDFASPPRTPSPVIPPAPHPSYIVGGSPLKELIIPEITLDEIINGKPNAYNKNMKLIISPSRYMDEYKYPDYEYLRNTYEIEDSMSFEPCKNAKKKDCNPPCEWIPKRGCVGPSIRVPITTRQYETNKLVFDSSPSELIDSNNVDLLDFYIRRFEYSREFIVGMAHKAIKRNNKFMLNVLIRDYSVEIEPLYQYAVNKNNKEMADFLLSFRK